MTTPAFGRRSRIQSDLGVPVQSYEELLWAASHGASFATFEAYSATFCCPCIKNAHRFRFSPKQPQTNLVSLPVRIEQTCSVIDGAAPVFDRSKIRAFLQDVLC